ncbi:hypothetical protein ACFPM7_28135 [Actinokineospora guangxiensis]|uniref:IrrE N-terminal-like domain-containing protein n=1 Tax=Actinokineospora guangxiensis TaxID=1490288 RepID=A0ABW0EUF9_9PSEU
MRSEARAHYEELLKQSRFISVSQLFARVPTEYWWMLGGDDFHDQFLAVMSDDIREAVDSRGGWDLTDLVIGVSDEPVDGIAEYRRFSDDSCLVLVSDGQLFLGNAIANYYTALYGRYITLPKIGRMLVAATIGPGWRYYAHVAGNHGATVGGILRTYALNRFALNDDSTGADIADSLPPLFRTRGRLLSFVSNIATYSWKFIALHELAHFVLKHDLAPSCDPVANELAADKFAIESLVRWGETQAFRDLPEAERRRGSSYYATLAAAIALLSSRFQERVNLVLPGITHPGYTERIQAIWSILEEDERQAAELMFMVVQEGADIASNLSSQLHQADWQRAQKADVITSGKSSWGSRVQAARDESSVHSPTLAEWQRTVHPLARVEAVANGIAHLQAGRLESALDAWGVIQFSSMLQGYKAVPFTSLRDAIESSPAFGMIADDYERLRTSTMMARQCSVLARKAVK